MKYQFSFLSTIALSAFLMLTVIGLLVWQIGWGVLAVLLASVLVFMAISVTQNWLRERGGKTRGLKL